MVNPYSSGVPCVSDEEQYTLDHTWPRARQAAKELDSLLRKERDARAKLKEAQNVGNKNPLTEQSALTDTILLRGEAETRLRFAKYELSAAVLRFVQIKRSKDIAFTFHYDDRGEIIEIETSQSVVLIVWDGEEWLRYVLGKTET